MTTAYKILMVGLLASLTGCVTVQSSIKSDAIPTFQRVLIVTKMRNAPDSYVRQFARTFPAGYEVCTLALSPLSFDNPDVAIKKQLDECHSDVILTIELVQAGHAGRYRNYSSYPYQYNAEMQSVATGQPFWKAIISSNPTYGEQVPPGSVIKRLLADHIIAGKIPTISKLQALN
ncbi:hypothetical protein BH09BAC4_BH09BAC4_50010 [soil metagenome]